MIMSKKQQHSLKRDYLKKEKKEKMRKTTMIS